MFNKKINIKPIGTSLSCDENGYLVREVSKEKIHSSWSSLIADYVEGLEQILGDSLHSVYVRGSVAKGAAMTDDLVDFDGIIIQKTGDTSVPIEALAQLRQSLQKKYPNLVHIEMSRYTLASISETAALLALQGVCIYGEDLIPTLPRLKPGKETFINLPYFTNNYNSFLKRLGNPERSNEMIFHDCIWFGKRILRAAHELVAERLGKFSRDLYPCYSGFAEIYPEKSEAMYRVLELTLNPIDDRTIIQQAYTDISLWMIDEIKKVHGI